MENLRTVGLFVIAFIASYFIYLGYNEKYSDYHMSYNKTTAIITNKTIESNDEIVNSGILFKHKKNFRIKITYTYHVENKKYVGYCYNDGKNEEYLKPKKFIPIKKAFDHIDKIIIFYDKNRQHDSCVTFSQIKTRKTNLYYIIVVGLLFSLPIIFFIK
jgi:hypothetical protein